MVASWKTLLQPDKDEKIHVRSLGIDELKELGKKPEYDMSLAAINDVENHKKICFGTFNNGVITAYTFFATDVVSPENNSAGAYFGGIGMQLPDDVVYTYKCYTLPEYRGNRQVGYAIYEGTKSLVGSNGWLVTTVDVENTPSIRMMENIGLKKMHILREYRVLGKGIYRIPKRVKLNNQILELFT